MELTSHEQEDLLIIVPGLNGAEITKQAPLAGAARRPWDEASFFAVGERRLSAEELRAVREVYAFCARRADEIVWGTGAHTGSFNPRF